MAKLVIFTDLDGTLLHPETYSFDAAMPALNLIRERDIPLILCSSKTRSEIEVFREKLKNKHPFVSENGGGIFIPEGYFKFEIEGEIKNNYRMITLGKPYNEIRKIFLEVRKRLGIGAQGFGDMDAKEVAVLTGLQTKDAVLAKKRDFDEPFIFEEGESPRIQEFLNAIEDTGFHWTQGRFFHMLGDNDKGNAVRILKRFYEKAYGSIKTIGFGDKFNDLPFLKEVDYPILVQDENGSYDTRVNLPNLIRTDGIGPDGWNKEVMRLIRY